MPNQPSSVIGQKTMALSTPVVIASDQTPVPISGSFSASVGQTDNSLFTEGTTIMLPVGGEYTTAPGTLASGSAGSVQVTKFRAMHMNLRDAAGNEWNGTNPLPVSASFVPSGTQTVAGTVTVANPGGGATDESAFKEGTSVYSAVGGEYVGTVGTLTSGQGGAIQITAYRAAH